MKWYMEQLDEMAQLLGGRSLGSGEEGREGPTFNEAHLCTTRSRPHPISPSQWHQR